MDDLNKLLELNPEFQVAYYTRADIYNRNNEYEKALKVIIKLLNYHQILIYIIVEV